MDQTDWSLVCSNENVAPVHRVKEKAKLKGITLDFLVTLCFNTDLWSKCITHDRKNKISNTSG